MFFGLTKLTESGVIARLYVSQTSSKPSLWVLSVHVYAADGELFLIERFLAGQIKTYRASAL